MRIKEVKLKDFKRFDDLTVDLGDSPSKIIALVGPNGSGKSSVFDAFEHIQRRTKNANRAVAVWFYAKKWFSSNEEDKTDAFTVEVKKSDGSSGFNNKSFYIRTAYRFTDALQVKAIRELPDIEKDEQRPPSTGALDSRMLENYERMLGTAFSAFWSSDKKGSEVREELIGKINKILQEVLEIRISNLGDVQAGKGQLFFEKGDSKDFPYENLSSGEKEVVDIIIDLVVKTPTYDDTVFCIDEPELHLNTAIQRKLLIEIEKLIPDNCQLWVATHSIGFLRALQDELQEKAQVLDFSEKDYFTGTQTIVPIVNTRKNWQRIFETALEDLVGLVAPNRIVYCEGKPDPDPVDGSELGMDAQIYNSIFENKYQDTMFVSGGGGDLAANASLALTILSKAFSGVSLYVLKDRDGLSDADRNTFIAAKPGNKMLARREIENYLFDKSVLVKYCSIAGIVFDEGAYDALVSDVKTFDFKAARQSHQATIMRMLSWGGTAIDLKYELGKHITSDMSVYVELESDIFGS